MNTQFPTKRSILRYEAIFRNGQQTQNNLRPCYVAAVYLFLFENRQFCAPWILFAADPANAAFHVLCLMYRAVNVNVCVCVYFCHKSDCLEHGVHMLNVYSSERQCMHISRRIFLNILDVVLRRDTIASGRVLKSFAVIGSCSL